MTREAQETDHWDAGGEDLRASGRMHLAVDVIRMSWRQVWMGNGVWT